MLRPNAQHTEKLNSFTHLLTVSNNWAVILFSMTKLAVSI